MHKSTLEMRRTAVYETPAEINVVVRVTVGGRTSVVVVPVTVVPAAES